MNRGNQRILFLCYAFMLIFIGACENFQEEEYALSEVDLKAQQILSNPVYIGMTVRDISKIDPAWSGASVFSNSSAIYDTLSRLNLKIAFTDSCYLIRQQTEIDTIYLALENSESRNAVFFYNAVYDIQLIAADGDLVDAEPDVRTLDEVAASSLYTYDVSFKRTFTKVLVERHAVALSAQNYLIRLMRNDLSSEYGYTFRLCVLDKDNI